MITLRLDKNGGINKGDVVFYESDNISEKYVIQLYKNNKIYDLTGKTIELTIVEKKRKYGNIFNLPIENATEGKFRLLVTSDISKECGLYDFKVTVKDDIGLVETFPSFQVEVLHDLTRSIASEIVNSDDFEILTEGLKALSDYNIYKTNAMKVPSIEENIKVINSSLEQNARHVSGWVNAKSFGCKGDGITDDTQNFQSALDTGLNVIVPPGVYIVGGLRLKKGQILDGLCTFNYSWGKEEEPTILKSNGEEFVIADGRATQIKNIQINGNNISSGIKGDIQIDDDGTNSDGKIELNNCRVFNCVDGIYNFRCGSIINNCNFDHNVNAINRLVDSRVINSTFNNNEVAMNLKYSNDNIILGNKIEWNDDGIIIEDGLNNTITANTIDRNAKMGITLSNTVSSTIIANVIRRNLEYNIKINGVNYLSIIGNAIKTDLIDDSGSSSVRSKPDYNIYLGSLSNTIIQGNNFNGNAYDNVKSAIYNNCSIYDNTGSDITKSEIRDNQTCTIESKGTQTLNIPYPSSLFDKWSTFVKIIKLSTNNGGSFVNSNDLIDIITNVSYKDSGIEISITNNRGWSIDLTVQTLFTNYYGYK